MRGGRIGGNQVKQRRTASTEATKNRPYGVTTLASSIAESHLLDEAVRQHSISIHHLISPSHEASSPRSQGIVPVADQLVKVTEDTLKSACSDLGVTLEFMKRTVGNFFRTFTSYGLFRESTFASKLSQIATPLQLKALLAAIFIFGGKGDVDGHSKALSRSHFGDLANDYIDKVLEECGDDQPPLCLLQAKILVTHWMIVKGVRGRAWRSLGLCIRIAFELGLDSVDSDVVPNSSPIDLNRWCEDEERRRAFWALYEIDTFATVIKQVPNVTNWTPNKVLLPADDDRWFQGKYQQSSFLHHDFIERPKSLQQTGTKSARAWFLVLISFLAEANSMARPTGKRNYHSPGKKVTASEVESDTATRSHNNRMAMLNSIHLYLLVVPPNLKFHGQILDFGAQMTDPNLTTSHLYWQTAIYNVAILAEVVKLLALRPFVFEKYVQRLRKMTTKGSDSLSTDNPVSLSGLSGQELHQCFHASDAMLNVMLNCSELHYQYLNPCIAHASWLAATVKLLQQELTDDESERRLIRSQFEILKVINTRFIQYWEMPSVLRQNLDQLAMRLKQFTARSSGVAEGESISADQVRDSSRSEAGQQRNNPGGAPMSHVNEPHGSENRSRYTASSDLDVVPGLNCGTLELPALSREGSQTNSLVVETHYLQQHEAPQGVLNTPPAEINLPWQPDSFSTGSNFNDPELLFYGHNHTLADSTVLTNESTLRLDTIPTSWSEFSAPGVSCAVTNNGIENVNGQADFAYDDIGGELSNYLDDIYSGPFSG
ncbi:hypothetical protein AYL99_04536 [Fonsecaea erecta]|uniref:Xylanolytic transcriptional activator regulatory domain-containing protein n=1 Tax=Fonsecaea erecta TaxID=1367422 RepID=A0A178ZT06_9EURO|nr:hypothetical protein AYL99_04536 [Fonsecaea erecta]OAP62333.1 hypothetical protein AYL99_04536 [Fonsecaea erecta]